MSMTAEDLRADDRYCVACGRSLLGEIVQICPPRHFRYAPGSDLWLEQPQTGEYYFVCGGCGERLDEAVQDYLFESIVPEELSAAVAEHEDAVMMLPGKPGCGGVL